jgi:hypothetical protein
VLSNTGTNNTYIIANAVRIAPVAASGTDLNWSAAGDGVTGPPTASTQGTFTISRTYTVSGAAAPNSFTIAYYASTSPDPNQNLSQAIQLGSETISAASDLAVGNHSGTSPAFQITSNGSYYQFARLNATNDFLESDGSNDTNDLAVSAQATVVSGPIFVVNSQPGYSETGTWHTETNAGDYGGTDRWALTSGSNTATWQVTGLAAGQYTVQLNWAKYSTDASNAPFTIYDGSTPLQTVLIDQTQSPVGPSFGGVPFQTIGTVNISSGTLKVVLSNSGTNNIYIIANAVRIAPVAPSGTDLNWSAPGDGITGPSTASTQGTFTISRTYTVSGAAAPSSFKIAYYASTSSDPNQNLNQAIFLGTETISAAGDLSVGNHSGTSPAFQITSNGSYYLFAKLNSANDFLESDGNNDTNDLAVTAQPTAVSGPVFVVNGQPGYSETGTWHTEANANDYGGTDRWALTSGSNTATWQVTGLVAAQYTVQLNWAAYSTDATNAPFTIYDGSTPLQTVLVDQTKAPVGTSFGGVPFQKIAVVNISSGTLKVVLSNSGANNTYVIANAVRIAPVPPSNTDLNWSGPGDGVIGPPTASTQGTFTISRTYNISGAAAPNSFTIAYYASTSPDPSQNLSQAIQLGSETISAASDLAVGDHTGTSPAFQITTNGAYYLFARLNASNDFLESDGNNDTNDLAVSAQTTVVSGPVIVANGQAGYSETGSWNTESNSGDYGGTDRWAFTTGSNTATWQVSGLAAGQYTVELNWAAYSTDATNAPFSVYDGSTLLQTFSVDETVSPAGNSYGGAPFQLIGTFNISSGTLRVVLSNTGANNTYIVANAVRVAPA